MNNGFSLLLGVVIGIAVAPKVYRAMQRNINVLPAMPNTANNTPNDLPQDAKMGCLGKGWDCTQAELYRKNIIQLNTGFGRY